MKRAIVMRRALAALVAPLLLLTGCGLEATNRKPRMTLFIGVDTSGSFQNSGYYDDSMTFLAHSWRTTSTGT
jgi:hypothetical protein